jgi:hypothetical protein
MRRFLLLAALPLGLGCATTTSRARVVLISVDGLWARDLQRAESAGVRLPTLDSLRQVGELAAGVIGSFPSVTFPSHTTMITGVPPARHGVYGNGIFTDPSVRREFSPSYLESSEIRVSTIFDAARAAGLSVAAVFWPVTAHDSSIQYNIPDAWDQRPGAPSQLAALRYLGTPWLLDSLNAPAAGAPNDSMRAAWAAAIVRRWNPDLVALHLIDLDHHKHESGLWSDSAIAALRARDRDLSVLLAAVAATEAGRQTTVIVASDHGFLNYSQRLRPGVLLARAGLVTVDSAGTPPVRTWDAALQVNGGSVMILPRDSSDRTVAARIRAAIADSLVGPGRPIRTVFPRDTIALLGGDPRALWALDLNEGYYAISGYTGPLLSERSGGGHGYDQRRPELHAFFLIAGPGVEPGATRPLMRQTEIAGIVARILRLSGF